MQKKNIFNYHQINLIKFRQRSCKKVLSFDSLNQSIHKNFSIELGFIFITKLIIFEKFQNKSIAKRCFLLMKSFVFFFCELFYKREKL